MAKDRTRSARRRCPKRVDVSLFCRMAREIGMAFFDAYDAMFDFEEIWRWMTDDTD